MNQSQNGYTYQRGWAVPALGVIGGIVFVLGGGWLVLSSLFTEVGTKAAATIVMIAGTCGVSGVLLALVVVAIVHQIREPRVQAPPMPVMSSYDVLPASRGTPLIPSRAGLRTEDAKVALMFTNKQVREIPAAAMAWFFSRRGPEDMVRGTNGWRWANEAYSVGRAWLIDQQALRNDNAWIDKQGAMEHLGLWSDHVTQ